MATYRNSIYRCIHWQPEFNNFEPCYTLYPVLLAHEANKPEDAKKKAEAPKGSVYFVNSIFLAIHALPATIEALGFRLPLGEMVYIKGFASYEIAELLGAFEYGKSDIYPLFYDKILTDLIVELKSQDKDDPKGWYK